MSCPYRTPAPLYDAAPSADNMIGKVVEYSGRVPPRAIRFRLWYSVPGAQGGKPWCVQVEGQEARCYAEVRWSGGAARSVFREQGHPELESGPRGVLEIECDSYECLGKDQL